MKYLFLSPKDDNYTFYYSDLLKNKDVLWVNTSLNKKGLIGFLYGIHISKKLNKIINIPFKDIWIQNYKTKKIKDFIKTDKKCIVLVFRHSFFLFYRHFYEKWLKKINPNIKICFLFADIVDSYKKGFNINIAKNKFDALFSFDKEDSQKYGLVYYPHIVPFPANIEIQNVQGGQKYSIYFMGRAKKRLNLLVEIYKKLKQNGIKVLFEIAGAKESERTFFDENFQYIDFITYKEYLRRCSNADCLLEVMQSTSNTGYTTRVLEAISLNKKLISNNQDLINAPFYDKKMLSTFTSENDFNIEFLNKTNTPLHWNYDSYQYSADKLLSFLREYLYKKDK